MKKLEIRHPRYSYTTILVVCAIMALCGLGLLIESTDDRWIRGLAYFVVMGCAATYYCIKVLINEPHIIIDKRGIYAKEVGPDIIPWDNIKNAIIKLQNPLSTKKCVDKGAPPLTIIIDLIDADRFIIFKNSFIISAKKYLIKYFKNIGESLNPIYISLEDINVDHRLVLETINHYMNEWKADHVRPPGYQRPHQPVKILLTKIVVKKKRWPMVICLIWALLFFGIGIFLSITVAPEDTLIALGATVLFFLAVAFCVYELPISQPEAFISDKGVFTRRNSLGFVPWRDIEKAEVHDSRLRLGRIAIISCTIANPEKYRYKVNLGRRLSYKLGAKLATNVSLDRTKIDIKKVFKEVQKKIEEHKKQRSAA